MKNKKGFTLVELLAVIAILGVLIGLTVTSFIGIREKTLEKQYENVVARIITAAEKYAKETAIITASVGKLIEEGYLPADDGTDIYDPRTNKTMNCIIVNTRIENGEYVAELGDNLLKEDGMCDTYTVVTDYRICVFNGDECKDIEANVWFSDNVKLGVKKGTELITIGEFKWTSDTGNTGNESTITTNVSAAGSSTYKVEIITPDKSHGEATSKINIDKQAPVIVDVDYDNKWSETKDVTITVSDYSGSGIDGVYVGKEKNCTADLTYEPATNDKYTITLTENGKYYICVKDKVGNYSNNNGSGDNNSSFEITTIDKIPTIPTIIASDGLPTGRLHENNFTLSFNSTNEGGSSITYYYGTDSSKLDKTGNSVNVSKDDYNVIYYVKACNEAMMCSGIAYYSVNPDKEPPVINVTAGNPTSWTKNTTIKATITDDNSKVVAYAVTTSTTVPTNWQSITKTASYNLSYDVTASKTYYIWAKDAAGNYTNKSVYISKVDNEPPVITNVNINEIYCNSSEFSISFNYSASDNKSGISKYEYTWSTSTSRPTSGWLEFSQSRNDLSCGVRYYVWLKFTDNAGNIGYGRSETPYSCDACAWDPGDSGDSGNTGSDWVFPTDYCSNNSDYCSTKSGGGECHLTQSGSCKTTYTCSCCSNGYYYSGSGVCKK